MPPGQRPRTEEDAQYNTTTSKPFTRQNRSNANGKNQSKGFSAAVKRRLDRSSPPGDNTRVGKGDHLGMSERTMGSSGDQNYRDQNRNKAERSIKQDAMSRRMANNTKTGSMRAK